MQSSSRLIRSNVVRSSSLRPQTSSSSATSPSFISSGNTSRFPTSYVRTFSYTPQWNAKEAGNGNPFEASDHFQQHASLYERIQQAPQVAKAVEEMAKLTAQKTGVDLQNGDKPSLSMMYKLSRDTELQAAAHKLMNALREAGIEINPQEAFKALQQMGGEGLGGKVRDLTGLHKEFNKGGKGDGEGEK